MTGGRARARQALGGWLGGGVIGECPGGHLPSGSGYPSEGVRGSLGVGVRCGGPFVPCLSEPSHGLRCPHPCPCVPRLHAPWLDLPAPLWVRSREGALSLAAMPGVLVPRASVTVCIPGEIPQCMRGVGRCGMVWGERSSTKPHGRARGSCADVGERSVGTLGLIGRPLGPVC